MKLMPNATGGCGPAFLTTVTLLVIRPFSFFLFLLLLLLLLLSFFFFLLVFFEMDRVALKVIRRLRSLRPSRIEIEEMTWRMM